MKASCAVWVLTLLSVAHVESLRAQSNLLVNPSFEKPGANFPTFGCILNDTPDWYFEPNGGERCPFGGPNGSFTLNFFPFLAQQVDTIPGRRYYVKFASQASGIAVRFGDNVVNTLTNIGGTNYFFNRPWSYHYCHVTAASNTTWLWLQSPQWASVDDILLSWLDEPIGITSQPSNIEVLLGGRASLEVDAVGGPPLSFQWLKEESPLPLATNRVLYINDSQPEHAGSYRVIVSNHVGSVTSSLATLTIDASPHPPQIVLHPAGFNFIAGSYTSVRAAALGSPPLRYQWRFWGTNLPGATNAIVPFSPLGYENAGPYDVIVENSIGSTISLPAMVSVSTAASAGLLKLENISPGSRNPIYDVDGTTLLVGPEFSCQPYVGVSPDQLTAMSLPHPFRTNAPGSYSSFLSIVVTLPPSATSLSVYVQLRAWESAFGSSYEEARASGGKVGVSALVPTIAYELFKVPQTTLIPSFNLRAGLPHFTTGRISRGDRFSDGLVEWILTGAPGFTYLIERRQPPNTWVPFVILTNGSSTVTFVDSNQQNASLQFYRARMLD